MAKISVAMTTYNGEKYIEKQLESLRLQTRKIDEVIICDDRSKDNTEKVVTDYINKHNLTGWKFIVNDKNLGFIDNFKKAIKLTTGDYIFLADQDDEWHFDKIEVMANILDENDNIDLLSCNLQFIDKDSKNFTPTSLPKWYKKLDSFEKDKMIKLNFIEICDSNTSPGCTMCMRRSLADNYFESKYPYKVPHDWLINLLACVEGKSYIINKPLIDYRLHSDNAIGISKATSSKTKEKQLDGLNKLLQFYLLAKGHNDIYDEQIAKNVDYVEKRISLYEHRSIKKFFQVVSASKKVKHLKEGQLFMINIKDLLYTLHLIFK
mgnify:FL=1